MDNCDHVIIILFILIVICLFVYIFQVSKDTKCVKVCTFITLGFILIFTCIKYFKRKTCNVNSDCASNEMCSDGHCIDAPVPLPGSDIITYPYKLISDEQVEINNYLATLYPLMGNPSDDLWKTLDFFYYSETLSPSQFAQNKISGIGKPSTRDVNEFVKVVFDKFREVVPNGFRSLNYDYSSFITNVKTALLYDIITYPYTGSSTTVAGAIVNRFDPQNIFGTHIGYSMKGTHYNEFQEVSNIPNTMAYYIGGRDKNGTIMGFKDNALIEIIHVDTHLKYKGLDGQVFDAMYASYGDFLYLARGSGLFYNVGKVLNVRNKIEAIRVAFNMSKKLPKIGGIIDTNTTYKAGDDNPFYQKCPNTIDGFKYLVTLLGTDADEISDDTHNPHTCDGDHVSPDFNYDRNTSPKCFTCTMNFAAYPASYLWCHGNTALKQHTCCVNSGGGDSCENGGVMNVPFFSYNGCSWGSDSSDITYSWRALDPMVSDKYRTDDTTKLAWLCYVSCNGIDKHSGPFRNPWGDHSNELTGQQIILLTQMVAMLPNTGGIGDDAYIVPLKTTTDIKYDTVIMAVQPEIGCFATEIMTLQYNNSASLFKTVDPQSGKIADCNFANNPALTTTYTKTGTNCYTNGMTDCTDGEMRGVCAYPYDSKGTLVPNPDPTNPVDPKKYTMCIPPSVLTCDKVSWATPTLAFPVYPKNGNAKFDITKNY